MTNLTKRIIPLKDIKIPKKFRRTSPHNEKMNEVRAYYQLHGLLDKPVTVDTDGNLVDGYTRYLVAVENKLNTIDVIISDYFEPEPTERQIFAGQNKDRLAAGEREYIVGVFPNVQFDDEPKEYVWENRKGLIVNVGDIVKVKCRNKDGKNFTANVVCVRKFWSDEELNHRSITRVIQKAS